jgi:hypothetical protein
VAAALGSSNVLYVGAESASKGDNRMNTVHNNHVILKEIVKEIDRNRDISGQAYAMKNNVRGAQYENIAVGLEQAYRIIANEMAVAS